MNERTDGLTNERVSVCALVGVSTTITIIVSSSKGGSSEGGLVRTTYHFENCVSLRRRFCFETNIPKLQ